MVPSIILNSSCNCYFLKGTDVLKKKKKAKALPAKQNTMSLAISVFYSSGHINFWIGSNQKLGVNVDLVWDA